MYHFILWYLAISVLGLLTFPLAYHLFPALADRGYSLSRALGFLLWGFVYWLLVSFGVLRNETGGLLFALAVVAGLSVWSVLAGGDARWPELQEWLKKNLRAVLFVEVLFLVAFAALAFIRANNPEISGTEKPMEMAFINAILHSPSFPPHDPWLSGYAISYYYFGYVLTAMLAMLTATEGSMAFNLMLALVFAMSAIGAYGLLYNLLSVYWGPSAIRSLRQGAGRGLLGAFFAPFFLLVIGNVEGFLELLRAYGIGWGNPNSNFWLWLNMKDLSDPPTAPFIWNPRFWFWWRASRVLHDYDLRGNFVEVIDEFPFFSYLLGDLHPHVLAMPFGLLAAALALNLFLGGWEGVTNLFGLKIPVNKQGLGLMAVVLGGLAFLNTWDFPIYLAVMSGAFILWLVSKRGWRWELVEEFLKFSIPLAVASVLLYLPFYLGFSSQAGGILPNVIFPTRGVYLWIMFGTLLVPIFLWLVSLIGQHSADWKKGLLIAAGFTLVLWFFSMQLGYIASQTEVGLSLISSQGYNSFSEILQPATLRRLQYGTGLLTLVLLIGMALSYLIASPKKNKPIPQPPKAVATSQSQASTAEIISFPDSHTELMGTFHEGFPAAGAGESSQSRVLNFVLMFILLGGLLVLAPEFVYLRDQFGSRMNTVFKFYYQAWALWSLAAAFGFVVLLKELRGLKLGLFAIVAALVLMTGLAYPILSLPSKTDNFKAANPDQRTLDGAAYLGIYNLDDYAAIQWLAQAAPGTVVEAVGGSYSDYARVSTFSGQPSVLGWPGHESQWRGGYAEMGSRSDDISNLYTTPNWSDAEQILRRYNIRYVYIGALERSKYHVIDNKFAANLTEVYNQGQVVIYAVH